MYIVGHLGLSVAGAYVLQRALALPWPSSKGYAASVKTNATEVIRQLDYRLVLVGALLPDLLDKPLAQWLSAEHFHNSTRLFGHTILFILFLLALALLLLGLKRRPTLLVLSLASLGHLVMDRMWEMPENLLWPFYGWEFFADVRQALLPGAFVAWSEGTWIRLTEATGAACLLLLLARLYQRRSLIRFIRAGTLD
jgi:membrane-bound metal-dependent hydrolase YbcI (DUF457 family)